MEQPYIAPADLRYALRARGIFLGRNENDTFPVLACHTSVAVRKSSRDYRQRQEGREDNPKTVTRTIAWNSNNSLLDALPKDLNLAELLFGDSVNYKIAQ